ncbi:hypothetical protein TrCOL_g8291 [Triparma columacea]|nr:hypothetical protein TrCOL_g8291 [Triparma columacea]
MTKPAELILGLYAPRQEHDGELKEEGAKLASLDHKAFIRFFESLALSTDAGFEDVVEDPKLKKQWFDWLNRSEAKLEWRNSTGSGPYNEGRASFTVAMELSEVRDYLLNSQCDLRFGAVEQRVVERECEQSNKRVLYTARLLPFPYKNRDYMVEQFHDEASITGGGEVIVSRSLNNEDDFLPTKKQSIEQGFVRMAVKLKGYLLMPSTRFGKACTEVVYVFSSEGNGVLSRVLGKSYIKRGLRHIVDELHDLSQLKHENGFEVARSDYKDLKKKAKKKIARVRRATTKELLLQVASSTPKRGFDMSQLADEREAEAVEMVEVGIPNIHNNARRMAEGKNEKEEVVSFDIFGGKEDSDADSAWFQTANTMLKSTDEGARTSALTTRSDTRSLAVGRFYQDVRQMFDCRHVSRFTWPHMSRWPHVNFPQPRNTVAYIEDVFKDSASSLPVPSNVVSDNIGEFKLFQYRNATYLYGNTNGKAPNLHMAFEGMGWEEDRKEAFLSGGLKNYLLSFSPSPPSITSPIDTSVPGTWLSYTSLRGTQKNFLFYEHSSGLLFAVVSIIPHAIYSVDPATGYMTPFSSAPPPTPNLGFPPHFTLSLSAGPIPLPSDPSSLLVASHVSVGGWGTGTIRQTFFYIYDGTSGSITCATPIFNFNLDGMLEYATHMELRNGFLFLSVGVNNCESALVKIRLGAVLEECVALDMKRKDLLALDYESQSFREKSCDFC